MLASCAYRFGYEQRDLPGGYKQVAIPTFKNVTQQVGIETHFTNELIRQFNRSQVAEVVDKINAPVAIEGNITDVKYVHQGQVVGGGENTGEVVLPANSVLTIEYRVLVYAQIRLRRLSDQKVLWEGSFNNEAVYSAPQVGLAVVNSVNPLYNNSARLDTIARLAKDMMAEAHDRMTENF